MLPDISVYIHTIHACIHVCKARESAFETITTTTASAFDVLKQFLSQYNRYSLWLTLII